MENSLSKERESYLAKDFQQGFIDYCQFKADKLSWGKFQSSVTLKEHHRQQDDFVHAGVMATMADHTAGYAAFTTVSEAFRILSIEFKINFLQPAFGHGLLCRAAVLKEGRQIIVAESEVCDLRDTKELLVAKATVTLIPVPKERLSG